MQKSCITITNMQKFSAEQTLNEKEENMISSIDDYNKQIAADGMDVWFRIDK